jgi:hypothetical protein
MTSMATQHTMRWPRFWDALAAILGGRLKEI